MSHKINEKGQYLLCITKSCDALRPKEKIYSNFAFAIGTECEVENAVRNAETDYYTYLDDGKAIRWETKFITIYISTNPISTNKEERNFEFDYIGGKIKAIFLGTQKELYAIRIMNNVFSNAIKIGVDLPHKK